MNWTELRVKLKQKYGDNFGFYNDKRVSGRRVKIWGVKQSELKEFISQQSKDLNVKEYDWKCGHLVVRKCVTVNFSE
jgi:hypothetical protein